TATGVLVVLLAVTLTTVRGGHRLCQREASVCPVLLVLLRTVTFEAAHAAARVRAHFVLMDDGGGLATVATGALARGPCVLRSSLIQVHGGSNAVEKKGCDEERSPQEDCNEYGREGLPTP